MIMEDGDILCCSFFSEGATCECKEKSKEERRFSEDLLELSEHDHFFQDLDLKTSRDHRHSTGLDLWEKKTDDMWLRPDENGNDGFEFSTTKTKHSPRKKSYWARGQPNSSCHRTSSAKGLPNDPNDHITQYRKNETEKNYTTSERYRLITSDFRYQQEFLATVARLIRMENESPGKRRYCSRMQKLRNSKSLMKESYSFNDLRMSIDSLELASEAPTNSEDRTPRPEVESSTNKTSMLNQTIESLAYPHYLDSVKESLDNERSLPDICDPSPIVSERLPLDASDDQEEAKASTSRAPTTLPNLLSSCNTSSSLSSICTQISSDLRPSEKTNSSRFGFRDLDKVELVEAPHLFGGCVFKPRISTGPPQMSRSRCGHAPTGPFSSRNFKRSVSQLPCTGDRRKSEVVARSISSPRNLGDFLCITSCNLQPPGKDLSYEQMVSNPGDAVKARMQFAKFTRAQSNKRR